MTLGEVMHALIDEGVAQARIDLSLPSQSETLSGTIAGYESCRGLEPEEMMELLSRSGLELLGAVEQQRPEVTRLRAYDACVRFVASVMSCALEYHGLPPITRITFQARMRYAAIVGWSEEYSWKRIGSNGVERT